MEKAPKSESSRRNRRFIYAQGLLQDSDYFSEKSIMIREPLLYSAHMSKSSKPDQRAPPTSLSQFLLNSLDKQQYRLKLKEATEGNISKGATETCKDLRLLIEEGDKGNGLDIEGKDSEVERDKGRDWADSEEGLVKELVQRIIRGQDPHVDYRAVDNNEEFDDLEVARQEAEDRFFEGGQFPLEEDNTDNGVQDF